jgi:hypothetical protein
VTTQESWPLCLLVRVRGEAPLMAALDQEQRQRWWTSTLPDALRALSEVGAIAVGYWRCDWSSDDLFYFAHEYANIDALEAGVEALRRAGFFRYLESSRLLGQRWAGEPGWNSEQWKEQGRQAALGGILYYRYSESLYTLTDSEIAERHKQRSSRLARDIDGLVARGGRRIAGYFCEWSSEFHLFVLYEFPDLAAAAGFNAELPERHGYIDYDIILTLGRRIDGPAALPIP